MLLNNRRQQSGEYHQYHAQEYHPAQAQEYHPAQAQEYQEYHPAQAREYREFHPAQTSQEYQAYYPGGYSGFDESDGGGEGYGGASDNEHMDEHEFLPAAPACAGGVHVICVDGKIVCNNSLDDRLQVAFERGAPEIRRAIFGANPNIHVKA